jgi:hypothetical protein
MKTENEIARMKKIEVQLHEMLKQINIQEDGEDVGPELMARFVAIPLSILDVLFAIRDGEQWRDLNSPEFIARKLLKEIGIGE